MYAYQRYGIEVGQKYVPADGSKGELTVTDVETYKDCDDVLVWDSQHSLIRRIDAFKLAMVRYQLVE